MYVGLLFVLLAWSAFLSAPWALTGPVVFVAYMTRFLRFAPSAPSQAVSATTCIRSWDAADTFFMIDGWANQAAVDAHAGNSQVADVMKELARF